MLWCRKDRLRHEFLARLHIQPITLQPAMGAVRFGDAAAAATVDQAIAVASVKGDFAHAGCSNRGFQQPYKGGISSRICRAAPWNVAATFRYHQPEQARLPVGNW